jgi:hypothetical protein
MHLIQIKIREIVTRFDEVLYTKKILFNFNIVLQDGDLMKVIPETRLAR